MRNFIEPLATPLIEYAARSYVAGSRIQDAIELAQSAQEIGFDCTLCYWNDGKEDQPVVADAYCELLDAMRDTDLDAYLALKIPALLDRMDLTAKVVDKARKQGTRVVFDSHMASQSTTTFEILRAIGGEGVGCAIPGRWQRSIEDVEEAIELGASVRVVKGQWPDPETKDRDLRLGYLDIIDRLAGRGVKVGIATHDHVLAADSMKRLQAANTACEQELVFPLPVEQARAVAEAHGLRTRLYIPFGKSWLPYSISRAAKNPKMIYWLMRDLVTNRRFKLPRRPAHSETIQ